MLANLLHIYKRNVAKYDKVMGILDQMLLIRKNSPEELMLKLSLLIAERKYESVLPQLYQLKEQKDIEIPTIVIDSFIERVLAGMK